MLRSLYIKNYALIEEFTVRFEHGLNIITGETGAGKSIVLGAFGLLIGDRASSDMIRTGTDKAVVEAEFDIEGNPKLREFLAEHELETGETLIVRREVKSSGSGRGFINDSPATAQLLKQLGGYLVDLHGQHEHQSLLRTEAHIVMLDEYARLESQVAAFRELRTKFNKTLAEIDELRSKDAKLREERDLYEFQFNEIQSVDPKPLEDEEIERDLSVLENAEEIRDTAAALHDVLYENEGSAFEILSNAKQQLERLAKLDSSLEEQFKELQSAIAITSELSTFLSRYSERIELEPKKLEDLRQRAQLIQRLKKKYGGSLAAVLAKKRDLEERLSLEQDVETRIEALTSELQNLRKQLTQEAAALTDNRKQAAKQLEPQIHSILTELGIEHGSFQVRFSERELADSEMERAMVIRKGMPLHAHARGTDLIEFHISTNAGEEPKPLVKVASGGEVSRIMLALKSVLAKTDRLPLLVFDEIDSGISGRIAQRVGRAMKLLGAEHQIIAISHLAQIAAFADAHFLVSKSSLKASTTSSLRRLSDAEHVEEVARLISGAEVSDSSLRTAEELIAEANKTVGLPVNGARKKAKAHA